MIGEVIAFAKSPVYTRDADKSLRYRLQVLLELTFWCLGVNIALGTLAGWVATAAGAGLGTHRVESFLEQYPPLVVAAYAVALAPVLEEALFRGPLYFFRRPGLFPWAFYGFTLAFGLLHAFNFPGWREHWTLLPLLVAPQWATGVFLGFIRVRFGLIWSMGLHALYNLLLLGPAFYWQFSQTTPS